MIYALTPDDQVRNLEPEPITARGGRNVCLPVSDWHLNREALSHPVADFVSPDGTTLIPVGEDFLRGATS